jgi:hypothetical protein
MRSFGSFSEPRPVVRATTAVRHRTVARAMSVGSRRENEVPDSDHLLGFGERAIGDRALVPAVLHAHAAAGRREGAEIEQHAGLLQLLVELVHREQRFAGRRLARFGLLVVFPRIMTFFACRQP